MRPSPNTLPARMRRPPSAVSMAMATRRKIRAVTGPSVAPKNSIVPFHLHADLAIGIGAAVALDRGRGALIAARTAGVGVDRQVVEAEPPADLGHEAAAHRLPAGQLGQ